MADQQVPAGDVKLFLKAADSYVMTKVDTSPAAAAAATTAAQDFIKAVRNGVADPDPILEKLDKVAEAVADLTTAVADLTTKVDTNIKLGNDAYNLAARASNKTATDTLVALRNAAGNMPPGFPTTVGGMHKLSADDLDNLSNFYGVPFGRGVAVEERIKKFEKFVRTS